MSKGSIFLIALSVILTSAFVIYMNNTETPSYRPGFWPEADVAVNQAKNLYQVEKARGVDFTNGPCLTNSVISGWAVDLVHSPRSPIDNIAQNQCQAYLDKTAKHIVELDLDGNVVTVK